MLPTFRLIRHAALGLAVTLAGTSGMGGVAAAETPTSPAVSFIVVLRAGNDAPAAAREWSGRGAQVDAVYRFALTGFAARMPEDVAERLRRDSRVALVERDGEVRATAVQADPPWGVDRVDQRARPIDGTYTYDTDAAGVTVYVLDTGIRASHTDFGGRVASGYTAIKDGRGTDDCHGHGTHVAGTAAGARYGVAKAATLVPVRVLDCNGSGSWSGVIAGIDWVTGNHPAGAPAVANMSLGGGTSSSVDSAVRNSIADGVTYAIAAGNDNADACRTSPARVTEALTVGATTSSDSRASFSNKGTCVDLFAPGASITSDHHKSDTATATMSGTSMASPHVAGIAALHLASTPSATPSVINTAVINAATTGVVADVSGSPNRLAYSRLVAPPPDDPPAATVPGTPAAPAATPAPYGIGVSWVAPNDGGSPITGYTVRVHKAANGRVVRKREVASSSTSLTVTSLSPGVSYYATVRATNAVGASNWSAPSNTVTATT